MNIDVLVSLVTVMLAISLAAERLVTALKSAFPKWLAEQKGAGAVGEDIVADGPRRVGVLVIAYAASYVTSALVAGEWGPLDMLNVGPADNLLALPIVVVALLATGGSAFWNNILGYTKAAKDARSQDRDARLLANTLQAEAAGIMTPAASARILPDHAAPVQRALQRLRTEQAPAFGAGSR